MPWTSQSVQVSSNTYWDMLSSAVGRFSELCHVQRVSYKKFHILASGNMLFMA